MCELRSKPRRLLIMPWYMVTIKQVINLFEIYDPSSIFLFWREEEKRSWKKVSLELLNQNIFLDFRVSLVVMCELRSTRKSFECRRNQGNFQRDGKLECFTHKWNKTRFWPTNETESFFLSLFLTRFTLKTSFPNLKLFELPRNFFSSLF